MKRANTGSANLVARVVRWVGGWWRGRGEGEAWGVGVGAGGGEGGCKGNVLGDDVVVAGEGGCHFFFFGWRWVGRVGKVDMEEIEVGNICAGVVGIWRRTVDAAGGSLGLLRLGYVVALRFVCMVMRIGFVRYLEYDTWLVVYDIWLVVYEIKH